jgi:hypothetical protein
MLRLLVLLLLVANAGYFAWTRGLLAPYGLAPAMQSEPQRLSEQIRPDAVRIVPPAELRRLEGNPATTPAPTTPAGSSPTSSLTPSTATVAAAVPAATQCLQAGIYNEEQTASLRSRLQNILPTGSWVLESSVEPARWLVYMGKYAGAEAITKKKGELRQLRVSYEALNNPALEPGLSLGSFASQAEAEVELARVATRGVKTARVIQGHAELRGQRLKLAAVDAVLQAQLDAIKPELLGKPLQACH